MRLQSRCRTELPSPEDLTGLEDPHPRCLAYMTSKLVLAVGMSTQAMWTSPWSLGSSHLVSGFPQSA